MRELNLPQSLLSVDRADERSCLRSDDGLDETDDGLFETFATSCEIESVLGMAMLLGETELMQCSRCDSR